MKTQAELNALIQERLKRIEQKSKNFSIQHEGEHYGDLGFVLEELIMIDSFLNDKLLTPETAQHEATHKL